MHDPRIEGKAQSIVHEVQLAESIELNDRSRHHVFRLAREIAAYWKNDEDRRNKEATIRNFNELRNWCRNNQPDNAPLIEAIEKLMSGGSIR
jgi:hypothetical protein